MRELPNKLTLNQPISVMGSDWRREAGEKVNVDYNIRPSFVGRRTGQLYTDELQTVKILDCDYPVVWFPHIFKELTPDLLEQ